MAEVRTSPWEMEAMVRGERERVEEEEEKYKTKGKRK